MRRVVILVVLATLLLVVVPVSAAISVKLGYGSGTMLESPDSVAKEHSELVLAALSGDWFFPESRWGLGFDVVVSGVDLSFTSGLQRMKAGVICSWDNVRFFAGPTWTAYHDSQGKKTQLDGVEFGGSAKVDFTDNLHLTGLFSFSPLLEGISIILPNPKVDTMFGGNISEYYFGLSYDLNKRLAATIGLGGWRVLEPVSQDRLVTVDYRRLGLEYTY